jgi:hypothetical protein
MGGTGSVTAASLVFAFTMASMVVSDLRILDQIGTTIGLGLLFDTAGCAVVHDAGHRHAARSVVPVVDECAYASGVGGPLSIGMRRYPAVKWVFESKPPG